MTILASKAGEIKQMKKIIAIMLVLLAVGSICYLAPKSQPKPLTMAICADSYWGVPDGDATAIWEDGLEVFHQQYPHAKVKMITGIQKADYREWLSEQLLAGTEPDVFLIPAQSLATYASIGAILPLNELMEGDASFSRDVYYPGAIAACQIEDVYYGLPLESAPTLMFVNKTLLAEKNIPMPSPDWTWQDFYHICQQVTVDTDGDGRPDSFGCYGYTWLQAALDNGVMLFSDNGRKGHFEGQQLEEAINFIMQLQGLNQGYIPTARDFDLGHTAFRPFSFAEYRTYQPYPWRVKKYSSFDWDIVPFPAGPQGKGLSNVETMVMAISSRTKSPHMAWELLKTLSSNQQIQRSLLTKSQGLPVRQDILTDADSQEDFQSGMGAGNQNLTLSAIHNIMLEAVPQPSFPKSQEALDKADSFIQLLIRDRQPLNNSLNQLQREINSLLLE